MLLYLIAKSLGGTLHSKRFIRSGKIGYPKAAGVLEKGKNLCERELFCAVIFFVWGPFHQPQDVGVITHVILAIVAL